MPISKEEVRFVYSSPILGSQKQPTGSVAARRRVQELTEADQQAVKGGSDSRDQGRDIGAAYASPIPAGRRQGANKRGIRWQGARHRSWRSIRRPANHRQRFLSSPSRAECQGKDKGSKAPPLVRRIGDPASPLPSRLIRVLVADA